MATRPHADDDALSSEGSGRDAPPTADEPGPHDVPDDEVIEQTLPAGTRRDGDSSRSR